MTLSRPNLIKLLGPLVVFCAVLVVLLVQSGPQAPELPALGAGSDVGRPSGDPVADAQAAVRAAPGSAAAYASLGDAYLQRARESGDPSFYTRAERSFDAALRRDGADVGALIGAGTLAGLRHDFAEQLRLGQEARRAAPDLARPYTVVADAQIELGRYDHAARSIQRLVDLKPGLAAYARASYFRELSGDRAGAVAAMRLAASAGGTPENFAYVQALVGDLELARGHGAAAGDAYRSALRGRCPPTLRRWSDSHGSTRRAVTSGRPPPACVEPPSACRSHPRWCCSARSSWRPASAPRAGPTLRGARSAAPLLRGRRGARRRCRALRGRPRRPAACDPAGPGAVGARAECPLGRRARLGLRPLGPCGRGAALVAQGARPRLARPGLQVPLRHGRARGRRIRQARPRGRARGQGDARHRCRRSRHRRLCDETARTRDRGRGAARRGAGPPGAGAPARQLLDQPPERGQRLGRPGRRALRARPGRDPDRAGALAVTRGGAREEARRARARAAARGRRASGAARASTGPGACRIPPAPEDSRPHASSSGSAPRRRTPRGCGCATRRSPAAWAGRRS